MKLGAIPENIIERILLALGVLPTPLVDTLIAMLLARTVMVATKLGVFQALAPAALTADEVASHCLTHPETTKKLLDALIGAGYLHFNNNRYLLAPVARKYLLQNRPQSLYDNMIFRFLEWAVLEHYEDFLLTGKSLDIHKTLLSNEEWRLYQRGMGSIAKISALEVAQRTVVPQSARDMLDIGGSHGYYSIALCQRHPKLRAVILDLPEAVEQAAPLLAQEGMGERVVHQVGNILTDNLGTEAWDVIFIAQVVHHFDDATNRELARRVARALRVGGVFVIQEVTQDRVPKKAGQFGALMNLFFAVTSQAGTWSLEEMADWQRQAGLVPLKPIQFRSMPGVWQQTAVKR
jgi:predicted O-methyltransferase YrrM